MPRQTPSQTVGPFFAYGLTPAPYGRTPLVAEVLTTDTTHGKRIRVTGHVYDGEGQPVPDAMVEIWQANAHGRYNHPADERRDNQLEPDFKGFGRSGTNSNGQYSFVTVKPGQVPGAKGQPQAPHLNVIVFARGMLLHAFTRIYFSDEDAANAQDPVLQLVEAGRRPTLVARREDSDSGVVYHLDIHLQGPRETVFFDV